MTEKDLDNNNVDSEKNSALDDSFYIDTEEANDNKPKRISAVPINAQLTVLVVILLLIFGSDTINKFIPEKNTIKAENITSTQITETKQDNSIANSVPIELENIQLTAKSALVWDVKNQKELYRKNPEEIHPLASITKLMTALLAYEIIETDQTVKINDRAIWQEGDSGLKTGEYFNFQDLLDLTLMSSSNDGAFALASAAGVLLDEKAPAESFVKAMNIRAKELGLADTKFLNPTGLDISTTESGAYSTASDVSLLLEYIITNIPELLSATTEDTELIYNHNGEYHESSNTNPTVSQISGLMASKTGYTELAGGNLTVAFNTGLNRPIVITVLGSTRDGRFEDVLKLTEAVKNKITYEKGTKD